MRLGRNDLCWCGSNKKYKKCHLKIDEQKKQNNPDKAFGKVISKWKKNIEEVEGMRKACNFNAKLMDYIREYVREGMSTGKIDDLIREYTYDNGYIPACLNYRGYPKSSCLSLNEVVCHGIPSHDIVLKDGDIVNVDVTSIVDGFHGDQSESFFIGDVNKKTKDIVIAAGNAMVEGIACVKPGVPFSKIGDVIESYAKDLGYSVVIDFTGHGIGRAFHEDPPIYHFKNMETNQYLMDEGMTFTIEPMVNEGTWKVDVDKRDKWTVRTKDRKLSAQFEHTVLVTENGYEILTLTEKQKKEGKICLLSTHKHNMIFN